MFKVWWEILQVFCCTLSAESSCAKNLENWSRFALVMNEYPVACLLTHRVLTTSIVAQMQPQTQLIASDNGLTSL